MRKILTNESTTKARTHRTKSAWNSFVPSIRVPKLGVAMVGLVVVAVLMLPGQRSSATASQCPTEGFFRNIALPTPDFANPSLKALITQEDNVFSERAQDDEDDDETCTALRQAYDTFDTSISPPRSLPARNLAVPSRLSKLHPLRC